MKLRAFLFCLVMISIVTVVAILHFTGTSRNAQFTNMVVPQTNMSPSPAELQYENNAAPRAVAIDEDAKEDCLAVGEAFYSGDSKVISMKFKSGNYFAYPQIAVPSTPQERKFNLYVRKLLDINPKNDEVCVEKVDPDCESNQNEADEETDFSVQYATPEFMSIRIGWLTKGSAGRTFYYPGSLNYDLEAGRPVTKLTDLFESQSNNLEVISGYVDNELRRCGYDDKQIGLSFWADKKKELTNYSEWGLTRNGVEIVVPLGPGDFLFVVVPYDRLTKILRNDVGWFRRLQH